MRPQTNRVRIYLVVVIAVVLAACSPSDENTSETLLVVGDWGSGSESQRAVALAMRAVAEGRDVVAILTTGDNFYRDNAEQLMEPYGWAVARGVDWWITWGNHDIESQRRIETIDETFGSPPRWGRYRWDEVDVIVLDSNQPASGEQAEFFRDAMASGDAPTIVALHHPPYTCSERGPTGEAVRDLVDMIDDDVFLVLSGHEHSYQRFETAEVTYVVTGGGGRVLQPLADCPADYPDRPVRAETFNFLALTRTGSSVELTAYNASREVIDRIEIPITR